MADRRTFLRGLASLPLIGGGVTLIGNPTAAAVPPTPQLLDTYDTWLSLERSWLIWERYGSGSERMYAKGQGIDCVWRNRATGECWTIDMVGDHSGFDHTNTASRAAVVLSAAGVPITGGFRG